MAGSAWLKTEWVNRMVETMRYVHPEMGESELRSKIEQIYDKKFTDHDAEIYNSYENITYKTTLGETVDWFQSFKPIIAESGVFFYPKHLKRNLNTEIIKECMLDARTIHKKEKFAALDAGDTFTARVKDIQQSNDKKAANSGYGAEGQRSSFLFNMNSAMSVTACGRGQISTAIQTIENFLGDSVKFFNMDEFYNHIYNIANEESEWTFSSSKVIDSVPSRSKWITRFEEKFLHHSLYDTEGIGKVYDNLSDDLRIRTYYKCNMYEFLMNGYPRMMWIKLMRTPIRYKKETKIDAFIDPNDPPESWKDQLDFISKLLLEFVGYRYGQFRYEDRSRYMKKSVTPVSDTDS